MLNIWLVDFMCFYLRDLQTFHSICKNKQKNVNHLKIVFDSKFTKKNINKTKTISCFVYSIVFAFNKVPSLNET